MSLIYVLITPARNEESFIEGTIRSVLAQTVKPARWIIVSDGSTDRTDEIVGRYAGAQSWIELIRMPERSDRTFAAKAHCFNEAYRRLNGSAYADVLTGKVANGLQAFSLDQEPFRPLAVSDVQKNRDY